MIVVPKHTNPETYTHHNAYATSWWTQVQSLSGVRQLQKPRDTWQKRSENSKINLGKESARSSSNNWLSWSRRVVLMLGFLWIVYSRKGWRDSWGIFADANAGRKSKGQSCPLFMTRISTQKNKARLENILCAPTFLVCCLTFLYVIILPVVSSRRSTS